MPAPPATSSEPLACVVTTPVISPFGVTVLTSVAAPALIQVQRADSPSGPFADIGARDCRTRFFDTGLTPATTYHYRIVANGTPTASVPATTLPLPTLAIRAMADTLPAVVAKAQANSPQWRAFKTRQLDSPNWGVDAVVQEFYRAGEIGTRSFMYALAYQATKDSKYADKALGLIKSAVRGFIAQSYAAQQVVLGAGDGWQRTFRIPDSPVVPASLAVLLDDVYTQPLVRGTGATDTGSRGGTAIPYKVSDTSNGNTAYAGSWRVNPDLDPGVIDWSPGIAAGLPTPVMGAAYHVSSAEQQGQRPATGWTLNGQDVTFATPPPAGKVVVAQYLYGSYQQSIGLPGGLNNITYDDYAARNLHFVAYALDWLRGYPGLEDAFQHEVMDMLVGWVDYVAGNGYLRNSPGSNYACGHYALRIAGIAALGDWCSETPRLVAEARAWRDAYIPQALAQLGGFWVEGWSYGRNAVTMLATATREGFRLGVLPSIAEETAWARETALAFFHSQPTPGTLDDTGDQPGWAGWPYAPQGTALDEFQDMLATLGALAGGDTAKYCDHWQQNVSWPDYGTALSLQLVDPAAPTAEYAGYTPQWHSCTPGFGHVVARSSWDANNSAWFAWHCQPFIPAIDHQQIGAGTLIVIRNNDPLLINAYHGGNRDDIYNAGGYINAVSVDDGIAAPPFVPFAQRYTGNVPQISSRADGTINYQYRRGDYTGAFNDYRTGKNPAAKLVRSIIFDRYHECFIVYDHVASTDPAARKRLAWHTLNSPLLDYAANTFVARAGASRIAGQVFSDAPFAFASTPIDGIAWRVSAQGTANTRFTTTLQVLSAGGVNASAVAPYHLASIDGVCEGAQIGGVVAIFGIRGLLAVGAVSYACNSGGTHYVCDLRPSHVYGCQVDGVAQRDVRTSGQGVAVFTSPGSKVTLTPR